MQNTNSEGNPRLRKCVEEIIRSKNIRKYEDFDFQTLLNLKLSASEIQSVIDSVWVRESNVYTKQIGKWMGEEKEFNPAPSIQNEWNNPADLLYSNLRHQHYKNGSMFIQSDVELWHVVWTYPPRDRAPYRLILSISTAVAPPKQQYFLVASSLAGPFYERVEIGESPELRKRKTVTGAIGSTHILQIMDLPRTKVEGPELALLTKINSVI